MRAATSASVGRRRPGLPLVPLVAGLVVLAVVVSLVVWTGTHVLAPRLFAHYDRIPALATTPTRTTNHRGVPGDPLNVALVADSAEIVTALADAGWVAADPVDRATSLRIAKSVLFDRPYPTAPVSALYAFGRRQDLAFEREVGSSARVRHHVRLWRVPGLADDGRPIWLGDASFDRSAGVSHRDFLPTHHITPDVDLERDTLVADLARVGAVAARWHVTGIGPRVDAHNAEGDRFDTDGELTVVVLPRGTARVRPAPPLAPDPPDVVLKDRVWAAVHAIFQPTREPDARR